MGVMFENNQILFDGNAVAMHEDCCCEEMVSGNCCGNSCTEEPKYLKVTISGVGNCGSTTTQCSGNNNFECSDLNGIYVVERMTCGSLVCPWVYAISCGGYDQTQVVAAAIKNPVSPYNGFWRVRGAPLQCDSELSCDDNDAAACFSGQDDMNSVDCNLCDDLPHTVYNDLNCLGSTSACRGTGGQAIISRT